MLLNATKSNYMIFGSRRIQERPDVRIHDNSCERQEGCRCDVIKNVKATKYLGVTIDEKLSWKEHVATTIAKMRGAAVTIAKLRSSINRKTARIIYHAIFEAQMRYGLLAYGAAFQNATAPMESLQNDVVRHMVRGRGRYSLDTVNDSAGVLPFKKLYMLCLLEECTIRNAAKTRCTVNNLKHTHRYETRQITIKPKRTRLCRTDRYYMNRYIKIHRMYSKDLEIINEMKKITEKKEKVRELVRIINEEM